MDQATISLERYHELINKERELDNGLLDKHSFAICTWDGYSEGTIYVDEDVKVFIEKEIKEVIDDYVRSLETRKEFKFIFTRKSLFETLIRKFKPHA